MTHPTKAPALLLSPRIGGGLEFETVARLCL